MEQGSLRMWSWSLVLAMGITGSLWAGEDDPVKKKTTEKSVVKQAVNPEIIAARTKEKALKGLKGARRKEALADLANTWARAAAVTEKPMAAYARGKEAKCRIILGDLAGAEKAWQSALSLAPTEQGPTALLGLGSVARRRQKSEGALAHYQELVRRFPKAGAKVEEAQVWIGKIHTGATRFVEARKALDQVLRSTASAARLGYVSDLIITTWLRQGDLPAARRALEAGRQALDRMGKQNPKKEKAAKRAREKMRGPYRLEKAEREAGAKTK